jgi:ankyrin repeat protein
MSSGALIEAVVANDLARVQELLAGDRALASARDPQLGSTALHFACHRGFASIVTALLEAGADVHAREQASDTTPLHWAAEGGHPEIAGWLLARGAALEATDGWYGLTPLGWSTVVTWAPHFHEDRPAAAAALIAAGARVDLFTAVAQQNPDAARVAAVPEGALTRRLGFAGKGMQPLHFAISRKLPAMARLLVELGADLRARTAWGLTPLALAWKHDAVLAEWLRARGTAEDPSSALMRGDLSRMAALLKAPAGAGAGRSLVFTAASEGLADGLAVLLRQGSDPSARVQYLVAEIPTPTSALHLAAMNGHEPAVRVLLEAGAAPSPGADTGIPTPLHLAAGGGHLATVQTLLDGGADVQARDRAYGATPRGWAEHEERAEVVALLQAHGG